MDWVEDELDLAADNLRNLAVEQSGGIGHERIRHWLHDTGLTLEQAAEALGISRRMLIYYRDGEKTDSPLDLAGLPGLGSRAPHRVNFAATYSFGQGICGVACLIVSSSAHPMMEDSCY